MLKRVCEEDPRPIREVIPETPEWLCRVIEKLHAKDPSGRFQTAREVADLLADCERQLQAHGGMRDFARIPGGKPARRGRWKWPAAAMVLLLPLAAWGVYAMTRPGPQPDPQPEVSDRGKTDPAVTTPTVPVANGWVQLFNGKDLTGWKPIVTQPGHWSVENGELVGRGPEVSHLMSERGDFENFHLRAEVKINAAGNSGIFFHSSSLLQKGIDLPEGIECEITQNMKMPTGSFTTIGGKGAWHPAAAPSPPADSWVALEIQVQRQQITVKVNERPVIIDFPLGAYSGHGYLALQVHAPQTDVRFRKIEIKELPPSPPAEQWVQLFNGKDTAGWKYHPRHPGDWTVKDGILSNGGPGNYLYSERGDYQNFHLRAEAQLNRGYSGIFFRAQFGSSWTDPAGQPGLNGYSVLLTEPPHPNPTGTLRTGATLKGTDKTLVLKDAVVQDAEADDAGGEGGEGVADHPESVVPDPHPPQPLDPTDGPLDDPPHLPQPAPVLRPAPGDPRLDPEPPQHQPGRVAVVPAVRVQHVRPLLRPPRLAPDPGEVEGHQRQDLAVVAGVGPGRADRQRHPLAAHQQRVLGPEFPAVHRAGAGALAPAERPHHDPVHDRHVGVELVGPAEQAEQVGVEPVPDARLLPGAEPSVRRPARAPQLVGHVLPPVAGRQHEPDDSHRHLVPDPRATARRADRLLGRQVVDDQGEELVRHVRGCHDSASTGWATRPRRKPHARVLSESVSDLAPNGMTKPNQWFVLEVIAHGNRLQTFIDGKPAATLVDSKGTRVKGYIALQQLRPDMVIRFRKIEIKELPATATRVVIKYSKTGVESSIRLDGQLVTRGELFQRLDTLVARNAGVRVFVTGDIDPEAELEGNDFRQLLNTVAGAGVDVKNIEFDPGVREKAERVANSQQNVAQNRIKRTNDLKEIGKALRSYHDQNQSFPPSRSAPANQFDKEGQPLLSWRVHLLPYLGEKELELYKKFHLNEPWDSEHNQKLLAHTPDGFRTAADPEKTTYLAVVGTGTAYEGKAGLTLADFKDGAGNTAYVVDAGPEKAVPWTKPDDLPFDPEDPIRTIGTSEFGEIFLAVMTDGAVKSVPRNGAPESLRALFTRGANDRYDESAKRKTPLPAARPVPQGRSGLRRQAR